MVFEGPNKFGDPTPLETAVAYDDFKTKTEDKAMSWLMDRVDVPTAEKVYDDFVKALYEQSQAGVDIASLTTEDVDALLDTLKD